MKKTILLIFIVSACNTNGEEQVDIEMDQDPVDVKVSNDVVSYKLIYQEGVGWGYQVFRGTKMIINQEHIPAVQGIQGFKSESDAKIVAIEIQKMVESGEDRPTLSVEFLDSLGVI